MKVGLFNIALPYLFINVLLSEKHINVPKIVRNIAQLERMRLLSHVNFI